MRRILSIDGGGIKGVFPASFLATVEEQVGQPVANFFDLIVGTSTGGIIALGLGLGIPASEILKLYEELGPSIFQGNRFFRAMRHLGLCKYSNEPLRVALSKHFGDRKLGESSKRLVVPSMNLETGKVHVFKTAHHPRLEIDYKTKAVDVAIATAAAPTYFPTHHLAEAVPLVDGGMWANNPMGAAVVEAIGVLGWPANELRVLSLGCTVSPFNVDRGRILPLGRLYWALKVADVFMAGQSSASLGTAQLLAGRDNITRIDPVVPEGRYALDGVRSIPFLKGIGMTEARDALPKLRELFFTEPAESFEPYHH